jgi:hypothetical protein
MLTAAKNDPLWRGFVRAVRGGTRFRDNGDGTVTDTQTRLMWEKKESLDGTGDDRNPHDADNVYTWSVSGTDPDGTAFTDIIYNMNNACDGDVGLPCTSNEDCWFIGNGLCGHAGYRDWRLPQVNRDGGREELETILLEPYPCSTSPCIDPIFGPTRSTDYWSSTTRADATANAHGVNFNNGGVSTAPKVIDAGVRAVRGGPRFEDNGDGTITDTQTGLMWEKKSDDETIHDMDRHYPWAGTCSLNTQKECQPSAAAADLCFAVAPSAACFECHNYGIPWLDEGTCSVTETIWTWLKALNDANFAGYSDWRLPEMRSYPGFNGREELESILAAPYPCKGLEAPCVPLVFNSGCTAGCTVTECSCTQPDPWHDPQVGYGYWSSSLHEYRPLPGIVYFYDGAEHTGSFAGQFGFVRAVSGGL